MSRSPILAARECAASCLGLLLVALPTPSTARLHHLGWQRDALGQLVLRELPRGAPSEHPVPPSAGSVQRLPMPAPPGESAFDRELAHEREAVTHARAKQRAALDAHTEALRKVAERNHAEAAAAEERRRAPRAERVGSAKKRGHGNHAEATGTHRPPRLREPPAEGMDAP